MVESTDTDHSNSPTASASARTSVSTRSNVPSIDHV